MAKPKLPILQQSAVMTINLTLVGTSIRKNIFINERAEGEIRLVHEMISGIESV